MKEPFDTSVLEQAERLDAVLARAADAIGDVTDPVMQRFYARFPDALAAFEHHGLGNRQRLEAEMVETALYCVMTWVERPAEVAIMLYGSVPHHLNTLHVRSEWYRGLLESLLALLAETISANAAEEAALLVGIRGGLLGVVDHALDEQVALA